MFKYKFTSLAILFFICLSYSTIAVASPYMQKLNDLKQSIQLAENQQQQINDQLKKLNNEKGIIEQDIQDRLFELTKIYHSLESYKRSGAEHGYLMPGATYYDYYYRLRTYESIQDMMKGQLVDLSISAFELQDKISEINMHLEQRDLLTLTIDQKINKIKTTQASKDINTDIQNFIKNIKNQTETLNDFLQQVLKIESKISLPKPVHKFYIDIPVSGIIRHSEHLQSNSIEIEGRLGDLVNSPAQGIVMYAGTFKNLGNLVIINHGEGYLSILRGLGDIFVTEGHQLDRQEPIATLPVKNTVNGKNTSVLYYELRYNNRSINPLEKMSGF